MAALASEQRVWRELTQFHFNQNQIDLMIQKQMNIVNGSTWERNVPSKKDSNGDMACRKDWQKIYHALRRYTLFFCGKNHMLIRPAINFILIFNAENTAYVRIMNIRKFWLCVDFAAVYFGHQQDTRALRKSHPISVLA